MRNFLKVLIWTYKNDFAEPLPELVLLLGVVSVASHNFLGQGGTVDSFSNLTWSLQVLILIFVAIGGVMSYSLGLERGQVVQQFLSLRISRARFVALKWASLFIIFSTFTLLLDAVAFVLFSGYFPTPEAYSSWGSAPALAFFIMLVEQLLLLAFLNSLVMAISFGVRRITISLLVFFFFALYSSGFLTFGTNILPDFMRLGYGDYLVVNDVSAYVFDLLFRPVAQALANAPTLMDYSSLAYRGVGAVLLFLVGMGLLVRDDLD